MPVASIFTFTSSYKRKTFLPVAVEKELYFTSTFTCSFKFYLYYQIYKKKSKRNWTDAKSYH